MEIHNESPAAQPCLMGNDDNDNLHGDMHPEGSNEVFWAADHIHLGLLCL